MHVLIDTETLKILAQEVTNDHVGDTTMFESLLGQVVDADDALHSEPTRRVPFG